MNSVAHPSLEHLFNQKKPQNIKNILLNHIK